MEKLLSASQVADGLGMHIKTLYRLLRENKIALTFIRKHGRMIAFRPSDVEKYLTTHEVTSNGAGLRKEKPRKPRKLYAGFLSDDEAQAFFQGCEQDAEGNYILRIVGEE